MPEEIFTLEALAKLKEQEEEEKNKLLFEQYLRNLENMVAESNYKIVDSIDKPKSNQNKEYICIKEPLEFIELFQQCSGQQECIELFVNLLSKKDCRVIDQIISEKEKIEELWFNSTKNGINLRPGLKDEEWSSPMAITLGDDSVHGLVAGRTGSGKSVFLNNMIFSLMAEYSPWELNIFLADFKRVEFSRYLSKYEVPHIKAVAATSEIRYVLSMFEYLNQCMVARQNFFALLGLQKLSEVRDRYKIVLPRVLLMVDEFQQLFLEATPKEEILINTLLMSITKLGRATGYHLIFASQEIGNSINSKMYANFKARFALACDADVSMGILGNAGASKIEKKGIVLANTGNRKEENNQLFKVPFITEEYFYEYLEKITETAKEYGYTSVHKFYQEDNMKEISDLKLVLELIKGTRKNYLDNNRNLVDIFTLGESVVFNYKKYDYETVFLEKGVRKNIGIFSPVLDDTAYICELLAVNFEKSPRKKDFKHFIIARNDLLMKKMDLKETLGITDRNVFSTNLFLEEIISAYKNRVKELEILNNYRRYIDLEKFVYDALCLRMEEERINATDDEKEELRNISKYFRNKNIKSYPSILENIMQDYECGEDFFKIVRMAYEMEMLNKSIDELFTPNVFWIIGTEMVGKFPKNMETVLNDATNYNMLFIFVSSDDNFYDFSVVNRSCDYIFVSGNNKAYYDKLKVPFTKKSEKNIVIDFSIRSSATQRSFKKFKYELNEVVVPAIDFDQILG